MRATPRRACVAQALLCLQRGSAAEARATGVPPGAGAGAPARGAGGGGDEPGEPREAERLLGLLQELEEEVFAATASVEAEEVAPARPPTPHPPCALHGRAPTLRALRRPCSA